MTDACISIVMPAYNAAGHIAGVVERVPHELWRCIRNVWIINDGSTDQTGPIINAMALKNGCIRPIHFERNRGYGASLKKGLYLCREDNSAIAVCLHADGQYPPEVIPRLLDSMHDKVLDILQGSRIASGTALSGGMPLYKFAANRVLTFLENAVFGLSLTDYHSGMLFYGKKTLETLPFERFSDSFDFDVEAIACARAKGLAIGEAPIPTHYGSEISHVRSIAYGMRVLDVMRKYLTGRYSRL